VSLDRYIAKQLSNPTGIGGRLVSSVMSRQNRPLYEETIRLLEPSDTDSILDIGCGNGHVLHMLARQCDGTFTGIDTSADIIALAARRYRKLVKSGKMTFTHQDVNAMSFGDGSFQKAYTINTVYFWEDLNHTVAEIRRVLKPNGLFVNTLFSNETLSQFSHTKFGYKRFTVEQLTSAGNAAGFAVTVIPILNSTAYCVLYRRKD